MREKDGDNRKRGNYYLSLRFRSIHLSSFDLSEEDPDNPSLSASLFVSPRRSFLRTRTRQLPSFFKRPPAPPKRICRAECGHLV